MTEAQNQTSDLDQKMVEPATPAEPEAQEEEKKTAAEEVITSKDDVASKIDNDDVEEEKDDDDDDVEEDAAEEENNGNQEAVFYIQKILLEPEKKMKKSFNWLDYYLLFFTTCIALHALLASLSVGNSSSSEFFKKLSGKDGESFLGIIILIMLIFTWVFAIRYAKKLSEIRLFYTIKQPKNPASAQENSNAKGCLTAFVVCILLMVSFSLYGSLIGIDDMGTLERIFFNVERITIPAVFLTFATFIHFVVRFLLAQNQVAMLILKNCFCETRKNTKEQ